MKAHKMSTFNNLWAMYPRKVSKRMAEKAFSKLNPMEQKQAIEAMPNHIKYWKSQDTQLAYIPHLATWLNQYRFEDEIVIEEVKQNKRPELPFYATEELTLKKANEVGITPYAGEGWSALRMRISNKIKQLEGQL
jgi:hypothetical protein